MLVGQQELVALERQQPIGALELLRAPEGSDGPGALPHHHGVVRVDDPDVPGACVGHEDHPRVQDGNPAGVREPSRQEGPVCGSLWGARGAGYEVGAARRGVDHGHEVVPCDVDAAAYGSHSPGPEPIELQQRLGVASVEAHGLEGVVAGVGHDQAAQGHGSALGVLECALCLLLLNHRWQQLSSSAPGRNKGPVDPLDLRMDQSKDGAREPPSRGVLAVDGTAGNAGCDSDCRLGPSTRGDEQAPHTTIADVRRIQVHARELVLLALLDGVREHRRPAARVGADGGLCCQHRAQVATTKGDKCQGLLLRQVGMPAHGAPDVKVRPRDSLLQRYCHQLDLLLGGEVDGLPCLRGNRLALQGAYLHVGGLVKACGGCEDHLLGHQGARAQELVVSLTVHRHEVRVPKLVDVNDRGIQEPCTDKCR